MEKELTQSPLEKTKGISFPILLDKVINENVLPVSDKPVKKKSLDLHFLIFLSCIKISNIIFISTFPKILLIET